MKDYYVTFKGKTFGEFTRAENKREARRNYRAYCLCSGYKIESIEEIR